MDTDFLLAQRLRDLRKARGYTLDQLAMRSRVSRSMISLIERQQTSPTASVLNRLADALGVSLAVLFATDNEEAQSKPLSPVAEQPIWNDPASGYMRRQLSPANWPTPMELVEVHFPPGETVTFDSALRHTSTHQQLVLLGGSMAITVGECLWHMEVGDCLVLEPGERIVYHNPTRVMARYLLASVSSSALSLKPL